MLIDAQILQTRNIVVEYAPLVDLPGEMICHMISSNWDINHCARIIPREDPSVKQHFTTLPVLVRNATTPWG